MIRDRILIAVILLFVITFPVMAQEKNTGELTALADNLDVHGFYELRAGYRLQNDPYEKDMSIMEQRLQLELSSHLDRADFKVKGDVLGDLVEEQGDFDLREAYMFTRPSDFMDVKVGRQVLTWGTGDMIFINDLFPKDWNSFFIGRDTEYLKAPSDAARVSFFTDLFNIDFVYTPQFDSDRYITGERISYWNSSLSRQAGNDAVIHTDMPDRYFKDDEIALRLYKNIENYEYALYAYQGYWKSPGGLNPAGTKAIFPDLNVYGASVRGSVGKGIGNMEMGYYDSLEDRSGKDGNINNSEFRFLIGYTQEIAKDLTAGLQYYLESMVDYDQYKKSSPAGLNRDENRDLITLRLTKLLMNQNLQCSLFTYFSPADRDVYMRPNVNYKITDNLTWEAGANIFFGDRPDTFFGQFDSNTNIYTAVRYNF